MRLKKEFIIVICIVVFIVVLEIVTNNVSQKSVDEIYQEIEKINQELDVANNKKQNNILETSEKNELDEKIYNLKNNWFEKQNTLSYFFEHDELEKVTKCVIVLEENSKNEEYANALEDGKEFIYWLDHFKEKDSLKLKNIF